jgi:hypothetical protein
VILAVACASVSASMLTGGTPRTLLLALLALGGLGLGTIFSTILVHLTTAATPHHAADISGVFTTCLQIAGAIGVAAFGTLYLSRISHPGPLPATHAFGVVTAAFALVALAAGATAHRATHHPAAGYGSHGTASVARSPMVAGTGPRGGRENSG